MKSFNYIIKDPIGIHARPAGLLTKQAVLFKETAITISKGDKKADAKRLFSIMGLGVKCGDEIAVSAEGGNEEEALAAMEKFLSENL